MKSVCHVGFRPAFISLRFGSGLFFTAASGKKPCLAHCRSFRRSLPKRKIFAVWTDLETWSWLSRCASLAMPADNEGKLIAYKWRKSAILETPEQIFLPGRNSRCTFSQTPLTPTWEKSGKLTPPPENFSARESSSNVQNRAFWKPLSKNFFKLLRTSINSHRSPLRIMPASSPVSRSILPAALLCKNRGKVETLFENFLIRSVQHRLQRVLSSYGQRSFHLPSISTWRKSAILETPEQKNCQHEARAVNCPTLFNVKIRAI